MQIILNLLVLTDFIMFNLTINSQKTVIQLLGEDAPCINSPNLNKGVEFSVSFSAYFMVGFLQYYKLSSPAEIL